MFFFKAFILFRLSCTALWFKATARRRVCEREASGLTEAGLGVGVDVLVLTPLHHTLQDGHQALQALLPQGQLLHATQEHVQGLF